jgi:hypothetical protein
MKMSDLFLPLVIESERDNRVREDRGRDGESKGVDCIHVNDFDSTL